MPDENSSSLGTAQVSQNNQVVANQTGDDFVLDFGETNEDNVGVNAGISSVELNEVENEHGESNGEVDFKFDEDNLFHKNNDEVEQNDNISIQDLDTLFEKSQNEGFDISLGSDKLEDESKNQSQNVEINNEGFDVKGVTFDDNVQSNLESSVVSDGVIGGVNQTGEISGDKLENVGNIESLKMIDSDQGNFIDDTKLQEFHQDLTHTGNVVVKDDVSSLDETNVDNIATTVERFTSDLDSEVENDDKMVNDSDSVNINFNVKNHDNIEMEEEKSEENSLGSVDSHEDGIDFSVDLNREEAENSEKIEDSDSSVEEKQEDGIDFSMDFAKEEESVNSEKIEDDSLIKEEKQEENDDKMKFAFEDDEKEETEKSEKIEDNDSLMKEEKQEENDDKMEFAFGDDEKEETENSEKIEDNDSLMKEEKQEENDDKMEFAFEDDEKEETENSEKTEDNDSLMKEEKQEENDDKMEFAFEDDEKEETENSEETEDNDSLMKEEKQEENDDKIGFAFGDDEKEETENPEKTEDNDSLMKEEKQEENDDKMGFTFDNNGKDDAMKMDTSSDDIEKQDNHGTLDFVMDIDSSDERKTESEISSGKEAVDLSVDDMLKSDSESNIESNKFQGEDEKDSLKSLDSIPENSSIGVLDEKEQKQNENTQKKNENVGSNVDTIPSSQIENLNLVADSLQQNSNESVNQVDSQETQKVSSTLSLDQILDGELDSSKIIDNSKSVSSNGSGNSDLLGNKKLLGVIVGGGLCLLIGLVAVMAFPFGNGDRKPGSVVDTGDSQIDNPIEIPTDIPTDIPVDDHYAPTSSVSLDVDDGENIGYQPTNLTNAKVEELPDDWDQDQEDLLGKLLDGDGTDELKPYVCDGDDCFGVDDSLENGDEKLDAGYIMEVISDNESLAEKYYSQGDVMQDKKLIKYSLQVINMCGKYEARIENGEGLDQKSFEEFEANVKSLMDKIQVYLAGDEEVETFINSSFDEEYDFTGKDEYRNIIYERSNGL